MKALLAVTGLALLTSCAPRETARTETSTSHTETPATATQASTSAPPPAVTCVEAPNRLCPKDEGSSDASFEAFRRSMIEAVKSKDAVKLRALIDPKIRTSFGDGGGIADFEASWKPSQPDSALWKELATILDLGGAFEGDGAGRSFRAPYVDANWPDSIDAFTHVAAIRNGVPIRAAAARDAAEVAKADWEILELIPEKGETPDRTWLHVRTAAGKDGWVSAADVRSPIGYRAGFSKVGGEWKMNALVSGD
jgi:hypothetical protein